MANYPINKVQAQAVKDILQEWKTNPIQILAWYTGSGKTNIFLEIVRQILLKEPKAKIGISCYLHVNIKNQVSDRASIFLKEWEVLEAKNTFKKKKNVAIFNPQIFFKRDPTHHFDYIIFDEAHVGGRDSDKKSGGYFKKIVDDHCKPGVKILGVTATPWDLVGSSLFGMAHVHARGLDKGLHEDGRIADFNIHVEAVKVKVKDSDFSRSGELTKKYLRTHFNTLREYSIRSAIHLHRSKADKIGRKCLIIVPPGHNCAIAKDVAEALGDEALYFVGGAAMSGWQYSQLNESGKIEQFRNDPKIRYLCVVHKCQIGFDMPELTSTVDMTMTRNISVLVQRWGRLARKTDVPGEKNYIYLASNNMEAVRAEWLINTSVNYATGNWGEKGRRKTKFERTPVFGYIPKQLGIGISFSEVLNKLTNLKSYTHTTISFAEETTPAGYWNMENMLNEARLYKDRTDMSVRNRYLYNKFLKRFPEELDKIFPIKNDLNKWNYEKSIAAIRKAKNKKEVKKKYSGALDWLFRNGKRQEYMDIMTEKGFPPQVQIHKPRQKNDV